MYNEKLLEAIKAYHDEWNEWNEQPKMPMFIEVCIQDICDDLALRPDISSCTFKDKMLADAFERCIVQVHYFDPDKNHDAINFFTNLAWYACLRRISKENRAAY